MSSAPEPNGKRASCWPLVAMGGWILAVAGVWCWSTHYEFSTYPPKAAYFINHWPDDCTLKLADDRPTLIYFVHPRCPCTRASTRELEKLLSGSTITSAQQPQLIVLANRPTHEESNWHDTYIVRQAAQLPRAKVIPDWEGRQTARFGVVASGTVMLFDASGTRLFAGGVTSSRGHEGDSAGGEALQMLLTGNAAVNCKSTPVFGCKVCSPTNSLASVSSTTVTQKSAGINEARSRPSP